MRDCKHDILNEYEEYPASYPYYAGRATVASLKKDRMMTLKKVGVYFVFSNLMWRCRINYAVNYGVNHVLISVCVGLGSKSNLKLIMSRN